MQESNKTTSYLLWAGIFFQVNGLHRLYNGKIGTGLLWFCTFGLFGIGQIIDLFLIPDMVDEHNWKLRKRLGMSPNGVPLGTSVNSTQVYKPPKSPSPVTVSQSESNQTISQEELIIKLTKAAQNRGGQISVTEAVLDTGIGFSKVEATLKEMLKKGYVSIDNHPENGVVIYDFPEISSATASQSKSNQSVHQEELMIKLAKAAQNRGGQISVTEAVLDTGIGFSKVEAALKEMLQKGYVSINKHPENGVVIYDFLDISSS